METVNKLNELDRISIYDSLRVMHKKFADIMRGEEDNMNEWEKNAMDALDSVLYLAEGVFAKPSL